MRVNISTGHLAVENRVLELLGAPFEIGFDWVCIGFVLAFYWL